MHEEHYNHPAARPDEKLLASCTERRGRTGGPGGQHRNRNETYVYLTHTPTKIESRAGERRSLLQNRNVALRRLRVLLAIRHREPVPVGDIGSPLWHSRVKAGRISCNAQHHDYPSLLAEAMDTIADAGWAPKKAALRLAITPSQLIKLVAKEPPALQEWNKHRTEKGENPLR